RRRRLDRRGLHRRRREGGGETGRPLFPPPRVGQGAGTRTGGVQRRKSGVCRGEGTVPEGEMAFPERARCCSRRGWEEGAPVRQSGPDRAGAGEVGGPPRPAPL